MCSFHCLIFPYAHYKNVIYYATSIRQQIYIFVIYILCGYADFFYYLHPYHTIKQYFTANDVLFR